MCLSSREVVRVQWRFMSNKMNVLWAIQYMACLHYDHRLESLSFMSRSLSFIVWGYPNMSTWCLANTVLCMRGIGQAECLNSVGKIIMMSMMMISLCRIDISTLHCGLLESTTRKPWLFNNYDEHFLWNARFRINMHFIKTKSRFLINFLPTQKICPIVKNKLGLP
jgi:hypothetical protein